MGRASNAPPNRDVPVLGGLARAWDARKYKEMERIIAVSHELAGLLTKRLGLDELLNLIGRGRSSRLE